MPQREVVKVEPVEIVCGITSEEAYRLKNFVDLYDTVHALCEERVGMAEQVKPAFSPKHEVACSLRDILKPRIAKEVAKLHAKVLEVCPESE